MVVFLTGASGFIGKKVLDELLLRPTVEKVFCLSRSTGENRTESPRVQWLQGDLTAVEQHRSALAEADVILHIAALASLQGERSYEHDNISGTEALLNLAKHCPKLRRVLFTSSIGAVDRAAEDPCSKPLDTEATPSPRSAYGKSKLQGEELLRKSGLPYTIIRPTWVYGPGMRADSHLQRLISLVLQGAASTRVQFPGQVSLIHVDDLAHAMVNALEDPAAENRCYFGATESTSLGTIFSLIRSELFGTPGWAVPIPRLPLLLSRVHRYLPLTLAIALFDFLWADTEPFCNQLLQRAPKPLREHLKHVIADHSSRGFVIVTGANSGIGRAIVHELSAKKIPSLAIDRQFDTSREPDKSENLVTRVTLDLREEHSLSNVISAHKGRVRGVINNAGLGYRGGVLALSTEQAIEILEVNCKVPLSLTKMLASRLARDGSIIINVASSVAYSPLPGMSVYAASKAFILQWSLALAQELRGQNAVVTISPTGTNTNFQRSAGVRGDSSHLVSPEQIARIIVQALLRNRSQHILCGSSSRFVVMALRLLPLSMSAAVWRRLFGKYR